ncbi:hypothetical protein SAY87_006068 [Trapa incisa]|uniref:DUF7787 domain-containing protein n=1 Tax=Trapa incisa TaxID=236973 RepID=A0AAN7K5T4_9MYRT|nr:hypothetical protein SAY87_006068 [Trapa incisa]
MKMERTRAISLDEYVDFFLSDQQTDLNFSYFNEILMIHGFRRLTHGVLKKVAIDAVKTAMDLMDPSRSTLKESVSSDASLELKDVIADLDALDWQDCCTTSFMTLFKDSCLASTKGIGSISLPKEPKPKENHKGKRKDKGGCCYGIDSSSSRTMNTCFGCNMSNKRMRERGSKTLS